MNILRTILNIFAGLSIAGNIIMLIMIFMYGACGINGIFLIALVFVILPFNILYIIILTIKKQKNKLTEFEKQAVYAVPVLIISSLLVLVFEWQTRYFFEMC